MPQLAGRRKVAAPMVSMLSAAACVALLGGCTTPQFPASSPGTTPSVWTGSPAPPSGTSTAPVSASAAASATTPATESRGSKPQSLVAQLKAPDGTQVATATFDFANGFATITIATTGGTQLSPGFHGLHIHKTGKCEPNSVAPTGGPPGDFNSAGGHFQAPGHTGEPASGDLTSLQVRKDGSANLVTTTDAFTMDDLTAGEKTAIIIHAGADNFANIPLDRYIQLNGTPGPDATTMSTGDAGRRVACGVIGAG